MLNLGASAHVSADGQGVMTIEANQLLFNGTDVGATLDRLSRQLAEEDLGGVAAAVQELGVLLRNGSACPPPAAPASAGPSPAKFLSRGCHDSSNAGRKKIRIIR